MPIAIEVKLSGVESLSKSQLNQIGKKAHANLGLGFRRRYLPDRFTVRGGRRLKYRKRSGEWFLGDPSNLRKDKGKYAPRKERRIGHSIPLVLTGAGQREALASTTVHATRDGFRIPLPRKYNFRARNSQVRMADEIRTVSARELSRLSREAAQQFEVLLSGTGGKVVSAQVSSV
jgi:hypothetical protein